MRRFNLAASGLGLSVLVSFAMANAPIDQENPGAISQTASQEDFLFEAAEAASEDQQPGDDPEEVLREEYLRLMREKAAMMDKTALEAALADAQQDIQELEADDLLGEAKAILSRVADEYPTTGAAREANYLIQQLNGTAQPSAGSYNEI